MENVNEVMQKIFEVATNAPELNMANYDENQVMELNKAMLDIYYLAEGALAKQTEQQSNSNLPHVSNAKRTFCQCKKPLLESIEMYDDVVVCLRCGEWAK